MKPRYRPYYAEYVRHCLRYYIKTLDDGNGGHPTFANDVEKENWSACHYVLKNYTQADMDMIAELYRRGDTLADKIYQCAKDRRVSQDTIWNTINTLERKIAKKRGLL